MKNYVIYKGTEGLIHMLGGIVYCVHWCIENNHELLIDCKCNELFNLNFSEIFNLTKLEFIENTSKAQFIIAPILKDYYNQGELTSVHVESVRMGIPAIYPDWYKPDPNIISSSIYFKNYNELENILIRLVENPKQIESISYLAVQNAKHYSLANVSEELDKFIQEV